MVRRDDTKTQALAASRTLNPRPERVLRSGGSGAGQVRDGAQSRDGGQASEPGRRRLRVLPPVAVLGQDGTARAGAGRPAPGQAGPKGRSQAHRPGRRPAGGTTGGRPRPAAGGSGRRGPAAFRRQRPSAFGGAGAAAPPHRPARGRAGRRAGPRGGAQKPLTSPAPSTGTSPVMTAARSPS